MKKIICLSVFFLIFSLANTVYAEMITLQRSFGGRQIIDRSNISVLLNKMAKEGTIEVSIGIINEPDAPDYLVCRDKWDPEKAREISNRIADYINKNNYIDPLLMLLNVGLTGCEYP